MLTCTSTHAQGESPAELTWCSWTYHAKGLWLHTPTHRVLASAIGSPNFGYRSQNRDLEAQLLVLTQHAGLQQQLGHELARLMHHMGPVTADTFQEPARFGGEYRSSWERRGPLMAMVTSVASDML